MDGKASKKVVTGTSPASVSPSTKIAVAESTALIRVLASVMRMELKVFAYRRIFRSILLLRMICSLRRACYNITVVMKEVK